jgi:hypothetical protein
MVLHVMLFPLAEYVTCSRLLFSCIYNTWIAAQTGRTLRTTPVISRSSRCACLQSAACGGIFICCENSLFMFRLRLWSCNNSSSATLRQKLASLFAINLDHQSTNSTLRQIPSCSIKKNLHPEHITRKTKNFWRQTASWAN